MSPKDDPAAFTQVANQPAGCVWELEVVDFEETPRVARGCPVEPRRPGSDAYLERSFARDV